MFGVGIALAGELGAAIALVLCFVVFRTAPVKFEDVEAALIIMAAIGILASIVFGVVMPNIAGLYY